ncbi:MAG TPA: signal recognition particle receptor subunit alpha, partial [Pyrinomonadaceae bacterium]|nr:signal recognition particle receptor subunit alpha [Pyrinomonadaceae bacterium]
MGLFWRRKKDDFVSLRLNEPVEAKPEPQVKQETPAPPPVERPVEAAPVQPRVEPPQQTVKPEPVPARSTFSSSILGLDRSMEELQAQEAALEQEFSARFRRAVAATRDSLSERLDTVFAGRKQIDDELLDQLEEVLIAADIGVPTTLDILETV